MAWTYNLAQINTTTSEGRKNTVRFLIGDTDANEGQVQDEEILFALQVNSDRVYPAAAMCALSIYTKYAKLVNTELDEALRADYSDLAKNYKTVYGILSEKSNVSDARLKMFVTGTGLQAGEINRYRFVNQEAGKYVPNC